MTDRYTTPIEIPFPAEHDLHLRLTAGACRFSIKPGDGAAWVSGTYRDPSGKRVARVERDAGTVRLTAAENPMDEVLGLFDGVPQYDLVLSKGQPYTLSVETGASGFTFDLGGLPLTRFVVKQGAGKFDVDFSAPNPQAMSVIEIGGGAGSILLKNLANANCEQMLVEGGAASYKLDFGGSLRRPMQVRVTTGVASVEVAVPSATAVKVVSESLLGGVDVGDGFMKKEGAFWNEAALTGATPLLNIRSTIALGSFQLRLT